MTRHFQKKPKPPAMRMLSVAIIATLSGTAEATTIINASSSVQNINGDTSYLFLEGGTTNGLNINGSNNFTFTNQGNISHTGTSSSGVILNATVSNLINDTSGNIYGGSYGITDANGNTATDMHITNFGDISSAGTHSTYTMGTIEFGAGTSGVVDNYNTINGGRAGQVGSSASGIVTTAKNQVIINNHNGASIASGSAEAAIKILGGSTQIIINNDGEISGFLQGIVQTDGAIQIKNSDTGHITSDSQAAVELSSGSTLENHGNISGNQAEAILLDGENNHITLGTGSTLSGANNNVILSKSTGNTLTLTSDDANASVENGNITSDTAEHGLSQLTSATNSHWVLGGDVRLAGTTTDTLNVQGDLTLTGSLTQNGIGGGTTIAQGGTLALNDGGQMNGAIIDNGTLIFNKNEDFVFTDIISGSGSLIQSGTLTLTADNTYTGLTTINHGGILTLGNGTDTGNVAGDITNSGTLNINHNNSVALNGTLSGAGNLNQIGTGTTTLTAQNSVQGAVSVNAGTLDFAQEGNFTASALNVASAATLKLEDKAKLAVSGAARLDGEVDLNIINGGPLITADSITLGADSILNLTGASGTIPEMASQIAQNRTTVLQTNQGITGDFASVELGYQTHLDYILFDGTKSADGKSYSVGEELAWTSAAPEAGGTFTLANAGDNFNVDVVLSDENANITTGWDGKSLTKSGDGTLTLSAANTYTGGTTVNAGSVILAQDKAAGTGAVTVNNAGNLDLTFNDGTFSNNVAGTGKVTVSGTGIELAGDAAGFTGMWDVTGGAGATQQSQLGNAQVLLDGTQSQLTLNNFSDAFASQLTGDGILQINQTSSTTPFSFASTTGSGFTGTVKVQQGTLTLDSNAEQTLTNSTLALTPAGTAAIDADRSIHSLIMGGGTLQMDNSRTVAHTLTTETFDASAGGRIQANIPETLSPPVIPTNPSYFDQDAIRNVQIVKATGQVTGIGNHIDLYNFDGSKPVGQSTDVGIIDGGVNLGTATYDQALVVTEDGAWVGYDLIKLDANAGQTLTLENQPGMDNMLVAQLTGAGNFDIQGSGTVILNNLTNDYTGNTQVSAGNVQLGSDNALGHTNDVIIASGAGLDINGKSQNITTLHSAAGSSLNLNGGNLTVAQGGESLGTLEGSGQLNLSGGELVINGENQNLSASIQIAQPATATMKNILGLGDGAINVDGNLNLSGANGTMSNMLSGNGTVALEEGAQVTLNNTVRTFAGNFTVATGTQLTAQEAGSLGTATVTNSGTLELNNNADWTLTNGVNGSGGVNKTGTGTLFADSNMTYTGDTHITEGALQVNGNFGSTGTMYVEQAGALKGHGSIAGSVINNGIIDLTSATQNNALTINGDYNSNNGQLWVNSELNGDGSAHDELFVKGNTSGNTAVTVKDMHGLGAQTTDGIELVNVQGQSDGTFALQGRAVAGAYEYKLYQGTATDNNGNWYLRSTTEAPTPPDPTPGAPVLRPEAGAYLANQSLANSVFMSTMHDRNGENRQTGEDSPAAWAHLDTGRVNSKAGSGQLSMGSNTTVLRLGSDIYRHDFGNQQIKAGLMTGYANVDTDSDAKHVSGSAKGTLEGYNFGAYGTWFGGRADEKSGPYIDSWMQYGTFHNTVKGDDLAEEKYHAHNWAGSLEAGYRMSVSSTHELYLQPQFQTIYSNYSQGDHTEDNGTRIHSQDSGGITTRLGTRLSGQLDDAGKTEPFVELNWWHGGSSNSVKMDTETVNQSIPVNRYEAKLGAQLKAGENWTLWINSGVQTGENDYSSVQGQLGGKYSW